MLANRVQETTTTTGTGTLSLGGAPTNRRTFVAGIGSGNTALYTIEDPATGAWEVGLGVATSGTPDTLTRATVIASSNANALVNFAAGTKNVFSAADADALRFGAASAPTATGTANARTAAYTPSVVRYVADRLYPFVNGAAVNTGAATLDLGPGAKNVRRPDGTATQAGDLPASTLLFVVYRAAGDEFWLTNVPFAFGAGAVGTANIADGAVTGRKESDDSWGSLASATTPDLGAQTVRNVLITGTAAITGFGNTGGEGRVYRVRFAGVLTLTHNATSLILPTAANIVTAAGDTAEFVKEAGTANWRCTWYQRASGQPLATPPSGALILLATAAPSGVAAVDFTAAITTTYDEYVVSFEKLVPATNDVALLARISTDGGSTWKASNYFSEGLRWNGGGVGSEDRTDGISLSPVQGAGTQVPSASWGGGVSGQLRFWPNGTTTRKHLAGSSGHRYSDGTNYWGWQVQAQWNGDGVADNAAINGIRFLFSSGNIASGNIRLYGVQKS